MTFADRSLPKPARCLVLAAALAALLPCRPAAAGPRPYAFSQGVDSLPDGTVELESWFSAEKPRSGFTGWDWWLGPVAGLTDRIEAGLFAIFEQPPVAPGATSSVALSSLRAHASWLLADKGAWPIDVRLRAEYGQRVAAGTPNTGWFTAILSRDLGRVNLTANLGGYLEMADDETVPYFVGSFGGTVELPAGFRLGGEIFSEKELKTGGENELWAGPSLAYGRGRFWLAATFGFGLTDDASQRRGRGSSLASPSSRTLGRAAAAFALLAAPSRPLRRSSAAQSKARSSSSALRSGRRRPSTRWSCT